MLQRPDQQPERKRGSSARCSGGHCCCTPHPPRIRDALGPDHQRSPGDSAGGQPPTRACSGGITGLHVHMGDKECWRRLDGAVGARALAWPCSRGPLTAWRVAGGCRPRPSSPPREKRGRHWHVWPAAKGARATKSQGQRSCFITSAQPELPRTPLPSSSTWLVSLRLPRRLAEGAPGSRASPGLVTEAPSSGARGPWRTVPPSDPSSSPRLCPDSPFWGRGLWTSPNRKRKNALPVAT